MYAHKQVKEGFKLKDDIINNNIDYQKLGLRIKEVRINNKLTQENLAAKVGCNVSHISNIENSHT